MNIYHILFALKQGFNRNLTWYENLFVKFYNNTIAKLTAKILRIKGNTVSFNQLNNNFTSSGTDGVIFTNNQDGSWTLNNTASGTNCFYNINYSSDPTKRLIVIEGHKYYIRGFSADVGFQFTFYNHQADYIRQFGEYIFTSSYTDNTWLRFQIPNGASFNNKKVYPQIHDLTLMGLDTLTLEQVQTWFANYFPLPCYDYQQSLISFNGTGLKTVGFNQWDEQWRNCDINPETGEIISGSYVVAKNFISVLPNTDYYICVKSYAGTGNVYLYQYSADLTYLGLSKYKNMRPNTIFKTDNKASYILFLLGGFYGTTYKNDVCLNISDTSKNGTYEPYTSNTLSLPTQTYFPFGEDGLDTVYDELLSTDVWKRMGIVNLGNLVWEYGGNNKFYASLNNVKIVASNVKGNILCAKYITDTYGNVYDTTTDKTIAVHNTRNKIYVYDSSYSSATAFKESLADTYAVYELSTPLHNYGVVDLGELEWTLSLNSNYFYAILPNNSVANTLSAVCPKYRISNDGTSIYNGAIDKVLGVALPYISGNTNRVFIRDTDYNNATALKNSLANTYLLYELETPVAPSSMEDTYPVWNGGTEQILPVNTSTPTTSGIVADIKYPDGIRYDQTFVYRVIEKVSQLGNRALSIMLGKKVETDNPEEPLEILLKGEK